MIRQNYILSTWLWHSRPLDLILFSNFALSTTVLEAAVDLKWTFWKPKLELKEKVLVHLCTLRNNGRVAIVAINQNYFLFFLSSFFLEFGLENAVDWAELSSSSSSSELPLSPDWNKPFLKFSRNPVQMEIRKAS